MKLELQDFYKLLVRPTVVISTISPGGVSNAAPFSWNSPMATKPKPFFGFCSNVNHDTWRNIKENKEFVVNMVGEDFGPLMEIMEKDFPYEVSEIEECGLTEVKANQIRPPRIQEAYGWLECKMTNYISLSERNVWIIGEVLDAEAKDEAFDDVVDVAKVKPLNHIWGEAFVKDMKITRFKRA
ncbi:MAG: flavin reductase family protein [Candidatus Bathyarchaeota archaeon]|nr:flavin reductase family protein [Candidatus Bathyarchaeota archaeon]